MALCYFKISKCWGICNIVDNVGYAKRIAYTEWNNHYDGWKQFQISTFWVCAQYFGMHKKHLFVQSGFNLDTLSVYIPWHCGNNDFRLSRHLASSNFPISLSIACAQKVNTRMWAQPSIAETGHRLGLYTTHTTNLEIHLMVDQLIARHWLQVIMEWTSPIMMWREPDNRET